MNISWIKLDINILNDAKIKKLETFPEGAELFKLWIGILCLAMKSDYAGYIYITQGIPYTPKDLSNEFNIKESTVEMGLKLFQSFNMVNINEGGVIEVINFNKHQEIDKIETIREQNRIRQKRYRDKQRAKLLEDHSEKITQTSRVTNDTDKIRLDQIRSDKIYRSENQQEDLCKDRKKRSVLPYKDIIDDLNDKAETNFKHTTKSTKEHIRARFNEGFKLDDFYCVNYIKYHQWYNDPKMRQYLRPRTLYGTKFESYLNEYYVFEKKQKEEESSGRDYTLQDYLGGKN